MGEFNIQCSHFAQIDFFFVPRRHGATSVGEFKSQGYLAPAMVNYLSLLGWNDGTEQEIFAVGWF